MAILKVYEKRRSVYALGKDCPLDKAEMQKLLADVFAVLPSAFNSQPVRAVLLSGASHDKLWDIVLAALRAKVPADKFQPTADKVALFAGAAGTILWFCDDDVTTRLCGQFPSYADRFPTWAEHAEGIAQFAVWCALAEREVGANLQHYNPLIDGAVKAAFDIPGTWRLVAQMPFGAIGGMDAAKPRLPAAETVLVRE
jgi:predicted oxidoreductase (fatty acid repression mutant protein)